MAGSLNSNAKSCVRNKDIVERSHAEYRGEAAEGSDLWGGKELAAHVLLWMMLRLHRLESVLRGCTGFDDSLPSGSIDPLGREERRGAGEGTHLALADSISDLRKPSDSKVRRMVSTSVSREGQELLASRVLGSEERKDWMFQKVR
jgi:hypothetical protein